MRPDQTYGPQTYADVTYYLRGDSQQRTLPSNGDSSESSTRKWLSTNPPKAHAYVRIDDEPAGLALTVAQLHPIEGSDKLGQKKYKTQVKGPLGKLVHPTDFGWDIIDGDNSSWIMHSLLFIHITSFITYCQNTLCASDRYFMKSHIKPLNDEKM